MGRKPQIYDQFGRPIDRSGLSAPIMSASIGGVRSPITGYPADGLTLVGEDEDWVETAKSLDNRPRDPIEND